MNRAKIVVVLLQSFEVPLRLREIEISTGSAKTTVRRECRILFRRGFVEMVSKGYYKMTFESATKLFQNDIELAITCNLATELNRINKKYQKEIEKRKSQKTK